MDETNNKKNKLPIRTLTSSNLAGPNAPPAGTRTLNFEAKLDLASHSPHMTVTSADFSGPESQRKLLSDLANTLKNAFAGPPNWTLFEAEINSGKDSEALLDSLAANLRIHGFKTDDRHIAALKKFDISQLNQSALFGYFSLMFLVYEKRGEYSLAIDSANLALVKAKEMDSPEKVLGTMQAIGMVRFALEQGDVEEYHREVIRYAEKHGLADQLAWVFHNWGSYLWNKGKFLDALALYERETPLREKEGVHEYAAHLAFLAEQQDLFQPKEALRCMEALLKLESTSPGTIAADFLAETYYRLARMKLRQGSAPSSYLPDAISAYELYRTLPAMEGRTAWSAGLVAIAHEALGNTEESKHFETIKVDLLIKYGSKKDTFRTQLARLLSDKTLSAEETREIELFAVSDEGQEMYLDWVNAQALKLYQANEFQEAFDLCESAATTTKHCDDRQQEEALSILFHLGAICLLKLARESEALLSYERAVELRPKSEALRWELCHNAAKIGNMEQAERHALILANEYPNKTGPYQVLARACFSRGDLDAAQAHLLRGRQNAMDNKSIDIELEELTNIKRGLLTPENSELFKIYKTLPPLPTPTTLPGIAEYRRISDFYRGILDQTCNHIHQLQKTPTVFIKAHRIDGKPLQEADFRDELERTLAAFFRTIAGETNHGKGRADLVVMNSTSIHPAGTVFEFKVWGRNDYRQSVEQVMKYMTDFQVVGVVFMINENKSSISMKYRDELILSDPSYISGSFRSNPIATNSNLVHFMSRHKTPYDREITIFHFIFNVH